MTYIIQKCGIFRADEEAKCPSSKVYSSSRRLEKPVTYRRLAVDKPTMYDIARKRAPLQFLE